MRLIPTSGIPFFLAIVFLFFTVFSGGPLGDETDARKRVTGIGTRIKEIGTDPEDGVTGRVREVREHIDERLQAIGQRIGEIRSTRATGNSLSGTTVPFIVAESSRSISFPGLNKGQLFDPEGLAVRDDKLYVTELENKRVQMFDVDGTPIGVFNSLSPKMHETLAKPYDVAVAPDGTIYVSDSARHEIILYTSEGAYIRSIGSFGQSPGSFDTPRGIACDSKGNLYVTDKNNARVQIFFNGETSFIELLQSNSPENTMHAPVDVAIGPDSTIYVLDSKENCVFVFDREFLHTKTLRPANRWREPTAIATDDAGNIYVVDGLRSRISMFDTIGTHIQDVILDAKAPRDIAIGESSFYITDQATHTIQVYKKWGAP